MAVGLTLQVALGAAAQPGAASSPAAADSARLRPRRVQLAEAHITATRASEQTGTAYQTLGPKVIRDRNFGQDLPQMLDQTPSVVTTSDGGAGIGYSGIRIRGTDPTRVNITLNGVPVNEAESHAVFFVNMPDLLSSTQSIQVQRGAGTSTNGAGAFGGSVNIETNAPRRAAYAEITNAAGSFGTWRTTVAAGTGLIGADSAGRGRFAVDARASRIQSEGYIDRAFSRLRSLYLTGTYLTDKTLVRALILTGQERTGQAWYGVPKDSVARGNRTFNPAGFDFDDFIGIQRPTPYDNQTDNYQQDYHQLLISHQFTPSLNLSATPFYTRGGGFYEEYKVNQRFERYNLLPPTLLIDHTGDTIRRTDVVRRRWLRTDLYGATWAATLAPANRPWTLTLGGAATGYRGQHFGEVTWARYAAQSETRDRYYDERTRKTDANAYLRGTWAPTDRLTAYLDGQVRRVSYSLLAPNEDFGPRRPNTFEFTFFNPKAGLTYQLADAVAAYASVAVAHREPTRNAYTDTPPSRRPTAERLVNYEAGVRRAAGRWQGGLNFYWMQYRDQLVLSGRLDDVGGAIPTNVADSYRAGIELTAAANLLPRANALTLSGNLALSRNRIRRYRDFITNYDTFTEIATEFRETTIAYSPSVVGATTLESEALPGLRVALLGKHVSRQYLDNTATRARSLDPYTVLDARVRYTRATRVLGLNEVEIAALAQNLLSERYESNGYTYAFISGAQRYDFTYLYPQAPLNFLASLSLRW
mgnify:CR=1 FL=1